MKNEDWKDAVGLGILVLCVALALSTCSYVDHRIEMEKRTSIGIGGK